MPILSAKGADINTQKNDGETLLIKLEKQKNPNNAFIASTLIELGANATKKDQYGKTAEEYVR